MADPRERLDLDSAGVYFVSVAEFEGRAEPTEPAGPPSADEQSEEKAPAD